MQSERRSLKGGQMKIVEDDEDRWRRMPFFLESHAISGEMNADREDF
jgi:hypothetical protein